MSDEGVEGAGNAVPEEMPSPARERPVRGRAARWLLADRLHPSGPAAGHREGRRTYPWWTVVCLTGVDYFSTLSYLPAIAAVAAGAVAPLATACVAVLTLVGVLPMYRHIARKSPRGQGSIAMLDHLLPFWQGKLFVLVLLGFTVTAWLVTITLSAADATVHLLENPYAPAALSGQAVPVTIGMLLILGGVFLLGFREAIVVAVPLVLVFLGLNAVIVAEGIREIAADPAALSQWTSRLGTHGIGGAAAVSVLAFPLLALGLSGFETGVSMMPLVRSEGGTRAERLASRIRNTRRMLTTAALIMCVFLISTSLVTTVLIPPAEFQPGGAANGRALAYLAHAHIGEAFGTVYDVSSILVLWFAGASAMAGLINMVPRYLPAFGMAPEWARAARPVVLVHTALAVIVTASFSAGVGAQSGAYATGILAMMVSAAVAVTVSFARARRRAAAAAGGVLFTVFVYALAANAVQRPDGMAIAAAFIGGIVAISLVSRVSRTTELRVTRITYDRPARQFVSEAAEAGPLQVIAHRPESCTGAEYARRIARQREASPVPVGPLLLLEVTVADPSEFSETLHIRGFDVEGHRVLRTVGPAAPNSIAALLLSLRDATGTRPHCHFEWSGENPLGQLVRYLLLGRGDTALLVHEIIRENEADLQRRPHVHVGG
ncbi:APC family permease [Nocardiopsis coralliicola]